MYNTLQAINGRWFHFKYDCDKFGSIYWKRPKPTKKVQWDYFI
jgi:hypothetical protein